MHFMVCVTAISSCAATKRQAYALKCSLYCRGILQVLLSYKGQNLAVLDIESKWVPNKTLETKQCYGTSSLEHPGTLMVATERGKYYVGGKLYGLELPRRSVSRQHNTQNSACVLYPAVAVRAR
eukprot:GHRR01027783.1.p1 GENE.GHRR01027783.1~~GHRR01027783.1.p1  ORF type:complete len:124 (-),score=34.78 GHRR01027783.1:120-491(-)